MLVERPFKVGDHVVSGTAEDEVGDDILQAETDADRKCGGDEREARQVDAGRRDADDRRYADAEIADAGLDRIAHDEIDMASGHHIAVEPA
ncbi:hypothetical protein, partial [Rhizobium leguminosarum]|uniref:hypothetical protein n=1 Tax=Rhizobium leguminosarum TaxID=384 RepID=UPI003F9833AB